MNTLKPISKADLAFNPFTMVGDEWLLITAQKPDGSVNTMTASWGAFGNIWGKDAAFFFIRPSRYTKGFVDAAERLSLCTLPETYRRELNYLGTASGRDEDKIAKAGLHLLYEDVVPYFEEANRVFICRKMYAKPFEAEAFIDSSLRDTVYPERDYHTLYAAEVEKVLTYSAAYTRSRISGCIFEKTSPKFSVCWA
jgi:flavin reductase (DIM6/NTAB) family NADH-FMN oxidoreductase RutF